MDLGPHAMFIWLCYAAVLAVVVALVIGLWLDGARLKRELAAFEGRGEVRPGEGTPHD